MHEDMFYFVCLFYSNTDADGVDGRFYEYFLVLVAGDSEGVEEDFGT